MKRIYLDAAATTALAPAARAAMLEWLDGGNPSSLYEEGRRARDAVDRARELVSAAMGAEFSDVVFTSGGTESANVAIVGTALRNLDGTRRRVILGAAEHACVLGTRPALTRLGYQVDLLPVDRYGMVDPAQLAEAMGDDVLLVSLMHANNELGTINPIAETSAIAHRYGAVVHSDAVQSFLKPERPWRVDDLGADLISVSAHKVHGPKGVGALFVRAGTRLQPLVAGGGQEREMRGGTENVAGIAGFGAAISAPSGGVDPALRDRFLEELAAIGAVRTVRDAPVLNGHAHVRFPGRDAGTLLIAFDRAGISASAGAACSSGSVEPSHVMQACGYSTQAAKEGIRFTLSACTTSMELADAASRIQKVLQ